MSIQVIVFDFDGTLVDSNRLKYDAFFELFPADGRYRRIVCDVLAADPEATRFVVLAEMLKRIRQEGLRDDGLSPEALAERYNLAVVARVKACPPMPEAAAVLEKLSPRYAVYLSSTTPQTALEEILIYRNWRRFFKDVFGYPNRKTATLQHILMREATAPTQILVVGDGESDRCAAAAAGCAFFKISDRAGLTTLLARLNC